MFENLTHSFKQFYTSEYKYRAIRKLKEYVMRYADIYYNDFRDLGIYTGVLHMSPKDRSKFLNHMHGMVDITNHKLDVVRPITFIICILLLVSVFFIKAKFYAIIILSVFLAIYIYLIVLDSSRTTYVVCVTILEDAINLAEISESVDDLKQEQSENSCKEN